MDWGAQLLLSRLIPVLRMMDAAQHTIDAVGQRDIAWYYFRDQVEDVLGLERGTLDTHQGVKETEKE